MQPLRRCRLLPAVAALVVPADPTSAVTMEGTGIAGRLVVAASPPVVEVRLVAEVAVRAQAGLEADVRMMTGDLALVAPVAPAEGAQETLEAEAARVAQEEEEETPPMIATTDVGVAVAAPI